MRFVSRRRRRSSVSLRGFTLVELLVVIAIIGILVALLLPAIQAAREAARRIGCQNNLHNLAIAVQNYENTKKALPPALEVAPSTGEIWGSSSELDIYLSWIVRILPQMEDQTLADLFDLKKRIPDGAQVLRDKGNPQEAQPAILLCPSDTARGRMYGNPRTTWNLRFGKGNYAAYVSPEHIRSMRVFPGAMINEPQSLSRLEDGTSKTLMLAEVRTSDHEQDSRGVWAAAWAGGSLLGFDMHSRSAELGASATSQRSSPYIPYEFASPPTPPLPPNSPPSSNNQDHIRDCTDPTGAQLQFMPCITQTVTRSAAAPRSLHTGGVNAANCDSSVTFITDDIEHHLMARMVSINDGQGNIEGYRAK